MPARRFPPPWTVEEQAACYVVRDHVGQALAYVYYGNELDSSCPKLPIPSRLCTFRKLLRGGRVLRVRR